MQHWNFITLFLSIFRLVVKSRAQVAKIKIQLFNCSKHSEPGEILKQESMENLHIFVPRIRPSCWKGWRNTTQTPSTWRQCRRRQTGWPEPVLPSTIGWTAGRCGTPVHTPTISTAAWPAPGLSSPLSSELHSSRGTVLLWGFYWRSGFMLASLRPPMLSGCRRPWACIIRNLLTIKTYAILNNQSVTSELFFCRRVGPAVNGLKVHKNENFFGSVSYA